MEQSRSFLFVLKQAMHSLNDETWPKVYGEWEMAKQYHAAQIWVMLSMNRLHQHKYMHMHQHVCIYGQ